MKNPKAQDGSTRNRPDRLKGQKKSRPRFVEFMRSSPLKGVELDLERDKTPMREK